MNKTKKKKEKKEKQNHDPSQIKRHGKLNVRVL